MTAAEVRALFARLRTVFEAEEAHLADLDAALGDGDHGAAMVRGFRAAAAATATGSETAPDADVGAVLVTGSEAFMRATGGASGPLFASLFLELGRAARGRNELDADAVRRGAANAVALVKRMGRAEPNDKTLLDALAPAAEALANAADDEALLPGALERAAAAEAGRDATRAMTARRGRAHWVEGEGRGQTDPGAASMALVFRTFARAARGEPAPDAPVGDPPRRSDTESERRGDERGPATKLVNAPTDTVDEMLDGYVAAYGDVVARVPSRPVVLRARPKPAGRVGLAIGNGTGHEPIAMGWVGHGMLDANALGEIFTAPPPDLVHEAIAAADRGAGVLLLISQHAGDVINGEMGVALARDAGIDARSLPMYDDVASAPKGRESERRGAPGTMFVYKIVGARAEEGASLDALETLGARVRDATRTLSVAIEAGTSPIGGEPMFELPEGEMFVGMGVHGEPGLRRLRAAPADEVVGVMLDALVEDGEYVAGEEVLVFVNGSGGTTLMELLICYRAVAAQLGERGIRAYRPLVGEYVTTQETKGMSISLCRADPEIKRLWDAPTTAPYFHRPTPHQEEP